MTNPQLTPNERTALKDFVIRLEQLYPDQILQTVLFGSKARGDSEPDSDFDILIILHKADGDIRSQILTIASRVSLEYDVLLNPFIIHEDRFQKQREFSLYRNVAKDAVGLRIFQKQLNLIPGTPLLGG